MDREDEKVSTELTQRQRELLEEMGLPADYDKLTDTQKNAVTSIEAMLSYLESKYQEEFCYLSYAEAGTLEKGAPGGISGIGDTVRCGDRISDI